MKKTIAAILIFSLFLFGCTNSKLVTHGDLQRELEAMVVQEYGQLKGELSLPDELGMYLLISTPEGDYWAQSGFGGTVYGPDTHYRIASVTKTFTAAAIMLLDQEGKLDIDDHVTDLIPGKTIPYLPDTQDFAIPYKNRVTIRQLLSHRAGIWDVFNEIIPLESSQPWAGMSYLVYIEETKEVENHPYTLAEMARVIALDQLTYGEPGTLYHYSDSGFMLLAVIIEQVSGQSYHRFLEERFFEPLGMQNTRSLHDPDETTLPEPYFPGYTRWDGEFFDSVEDNMTSNIGAGDIISTPRDMSTWIRSILDGTILEPEQVERMERIPEGNAAYALGLSVSDLGYGHGGAHPGYTNTIVYNGEHDTVMVVVSPFIDYDEGDMSNVMEAHYTRERMMSRALALSLSHQE